MGVVGRVGKKVCFNSGAIQGVAFKTHTEQKEQPIIFFLRYQVVKIIGFSHSQHWGEKLQYVFAFKNIIYVFC